MKFMYQSLALAMLLFVACKKNRVCSCTKTKTGTSTTTAALSYSVPVIGNVPIVDTSFSSPINEVMVYERTLEDVNKRTAKQNCVSYHEPYDETITNSAPPLILTTNMRGDVSYKCELK